LNGARQNWPLAEQRWVSCTCRAAERRAVSGARRRAHAVEGRLGGAVGGKRPGGARGGEGGQRVAERGGPWASREEEEGKIIKWAF
jgi:hypothetical protein